MDKIKTQYDIVVLNFDNTLCNMNINNVRGLKFK